ncbi:hypothetical protein SCLCIDRAFT_1220079 [Scleroderma citrinum Foug A]|uniref:Uncharacterized protein n=1 Tax=Scleroderma citrinum Foug A TaxID=1036808 RepID=A0A0C2ZWF0_9AGAM|nr:hypothetical protein SCLCIDRAFT_1220079 [Scleroderma citrinum Foug A]
MFNSLLSFFLAFVLAISYFARAAPVQPVENIVFRPMITYPTAGITWAACSTQKATWETDNLPDELKNATGLLLLGHQTADSENLDIYNPLASQFPLNAGFVEFMVPCNATAMSDYIVVLFGDSGNASPQFTITPVPST